MSLLEKAKKLPRRKFRADISEEEIKLAVSWLLGEITIYQINRASEKVETSHSGTAYRLCTALKRGVDLGKIKIEYTR